MVGTTTWTILVGVPFIVVGTVKVAELEPVVIVVVDKL